MQTVNKQGAIGFIIGASLSALAAYALVKYQLSLTKANQSPNQNGAAIDYSSEGYQLLKHEQLARVIKYFGEEQFCKMENSYVVVFGVGGVGSHVVNMLARSGVKRIKIVDFDRVSLSSLNRHSFAVREDVGTAKVQCIKKYISHILPHVEIIPINSYVTVENAKTLLEEPADYVVDCIDNMDAKVEIVTICKERNIRLIISGGAGMKSDPTKIQIRDISDCKYDSLVLRLRRQLHKKGIKKGITVAFSYQEAEKELLPLNKQQEKDPQSFRVFDNYRIRIVPVLGTMPAILGMSIASYVLCQLAGQPYQPFETDYVKNTAFNRLYQQLMNDQRKRGIPLKDLKVDLEEVCILAKAVYKWECLLDGRKEPNLRLVRWDQTKPALIDNLALMSRDQQERHERFENVHQIDYPEEIKDKFYAYARLAQRLWDENYMIYI